MTPHISGTSLDAQVRYATGAHDIVKRYLAGEKQEQVNLIVENGEVSRSFISGSISPEPPCFQGMVWLAVSG